MKKEKICTVRGTLDKYLEEAFAKSIQFSTSKYDFLYVQSM